MADRRGPRWRTAGAVAMACGALVLGGTGAGGAAAAPKATKRVNIVDYLYKPRVVTVAVGTKVVWVNNDTTEHNVESTSGKAWGSPGLAPGAKYSHTFAKAGTYTYHCSLHYEMTGKVVVTG